jgi:hypothetical protein
VPAATLRDLAAVVMIDLERPLESRAAPAGSS